MKHFPTNFIRRYEDNYLVKGEANFRYYRDWLQQRASQKPMNRIFKKGLHPSKARKKEAQ